jgi:hypothetical protein
MHRVQAARLASNEFNKRKKNNEPAILVGWSDEEVKLLRKTAPHNTKKWGKSIVFDTGAIASILAAMFPPRRTNQAVKKKLIDLQIKASD